MTRGHCPPESHPQPPRHHRHHAPLVPPLLLLQGGGILLRHGHEVFSQCSNKPYIKFSLNIKLMNIVNILSRCFWRHREYKQDCRREFFYKETDISTNCHPGQPWNVKCMHFDGSEFQEFLKIMDSISEPCALFQCLSFRNLLLLDPEKKVI